MSNIIIFNIFIALLCSMQYGEEEMMGDEEYDDYSKELNQYRKSKEGRGRGKFILPSRGVNNTI